MKTENYIKLIIDTFYEVIEEYQTDDKSIFENLLMEIIEELTNSEGKSAERNFSTALENYLEAVMAISKLSPGLSTSLHDEKAGITVSTYNGKMSDIPNDEEINEDTVFDVSSMTKMFTAILLLKKAEKGEIDLEKTFSDYSPLLKNIDIKIISTLKFGINIRTDGRVDEQGIDPSERIRRLLNSNVVDENTFIYSDIPYMLVPLLFGETVEEAVNNYLEEFYKLYRDELGLTNTGYSTINMTGGIVEIQDGKYIRGRIFDPKASIFEREVGYISGHAGVTTTTQDLIKLFSYLSQGFLNENSMKILTTTIRPDTIELLDKNGNQVFRNGIPVNINRGMGVYINTGSIRTGDIYQGYGMNAFAACGSTGTYSVFDIENGINAIHLSNAKSGIYHKYIDTDTYTYGDDGDKLPRHKGVTVISGTKSVRDGGIIREDGTVMKYVRATNNFKREELITLIKLRIVKRILINKAQLEYSGNELEKALEEIDEASNIKRKLK